ncbi:MAG TPA: prepilin peptidase [Candidatus Saccharimonadales bacterium]|nr:prepilin peptidase [Candidatus Saccharimonadales bacterium]
MDKAFVIVYLAALGLIFGSFVNALVWRLRNKRNWVSERSECVHCHHTLAPRDLIPVLSYIALKGKCRYCGKKIDDTPMPEVAAALLFVGSYIFWPIQIHGLGLFQFVCWLLILIAFTALAVYDLKWFLLPDKIVFPLIGFVILQILAQKVLYHFAWHDVGAAALGAVVLSGIFYILFVVSDGAWIGGGDVKLAIALGLIASDPLRATLILFFASIIGVLAAIPAMLKTKKALKMQIPFGPFLILATIIVQLFGASIVHWYTGFFSV